MRVTCTSLVDKRAPPPPATGGHAEACPRRARTKDPGRPEGPRAPSLPEGCGTLRAKSVAANTKTETEKQERERAENLKASSPCATRHQTRERETQAAPKNRKMLMFEECPLPQIPKDAPPLGWRHSGVVCAVLEFQSGNAILAQVQGTCLGLSRVSIQQIEHISSVVCTQQIPKSRYHCYTKFPFRGY